MFRITYGQANLYLPNPLFSGTGYRLGHEVILKKTLANTTRTVVTLKSRIFNYEFEVSTEKAFELEEFLTNYRGKKLKFAFDLFSVEGYINNDPLELIAQARSAPCREKISFELVINETTD